eukprot:gene3366-3855_t
MFARIANYARSVKYLAEVTLKSQVQDSVKITSYLISTSAMASGRTKWSYTRPRKSIPNMKLPRYLIDGSVLRGQRRSGRGLDGRILIRHKGGGHARNKRLLDMVRVPATTDEGPMKVVDKVLQIGYDPSRSARIAKLAGDSSNRYKLIIAADGLKPGDIITASRGPPASLARLAVGDAYPLAKLPIGTTVHCIEETVGDGAMLARAAGTYGTLVRKTTEEAVLKMNNKRQQTVPVDALAVIGRVSNPNHRNEVIGKAGRSRWLGRRPKGQTGKDRWLHKKKRI